MLPPCATIPVRSGHWESILLAVFVWPCAVECLHSAHHVFDVNAMQHCRMANANDDVSQFGANAHGLAVTAKIQLVHPACSVFFQRLACFGMYQRNRFCKRRYSTFVKSVNFGVVKRLSRHLVNGQRGRNFGRQWCRTIRGRQGFLPPASSTHVPNLSLHPYPRTGQIEPHRQLLRPMAAGCR